MTSELLNSRAKAFPYREKKTVYGGWHLGRRGRRKVVTVVVEVLIPSLMAQVTQCMIPVI